MTKKRQIIVSLLGVLSAVLITIGITYAAFAYTKLGTTENTVTAGTLKFLYTENTGVGAGIALTDALPVSDTVGKAYATEGKVFDFSIEATNTGAQIIPYEVTLRKKNTSTLGEEAVKVYLTDMTEDADSELLAPTLYSNLVQTEIEVGEEIEKTIYTDGVTGGEEIYKKDFRLRMWIAEETDFSSGNYNDKTFIATVNVYSNVPLVSEEEMNLRNNAEIASAQVGETELTKVEGQSYQYEAAVPEGTTETTINVETENPNSTVTIEKIDSVVYNSNINRMSVSKTVSLTDGDNYFKVTVLSENKKVEKEYVVKVYVGDTGKLLTDVIFDTYKTIYENPTLTDSSNNTSDASGLYKSTATNDGSPTYYFRGNVENNYIDFAGFTWRIVRINEDGTIRIVMQDGINDNTGYKFNYTYNEMYYSDSDDGAAKYKLDNWYQTNIVAKGYDANVVTGDYFCEEARVKYNSGFNSGSATMVVYSSYNPTFSCSEDGNGKGMVNTSVGLLTYDEIVYAGGYYNKSNSSYYLYNSSISWWTMSSTGLDSGNYARTWYVFTTGSLYYTYAYSDSPCLRAVINLKADTMVTGSGTSGDMFIVQ